EGPARTRATGPGRTAGGGRSWAPPPAENGDGPAQPAEIPQGPQPQPDDLGQVDVVAPSLSWEKRDIGKTAGETAFPVERDQQGVGQGAVLRHPGEQAGQTAPLHQTEGRVG